MVVPWGQGFRILSSSSTLICKDSRWFVFKRVALKNKNKKCCLCLYDSRWLTATPKIYPMGRRRGQKDTAPPPKYKTQKLFLSLLLLPDQPDLIMWSYQLQGAWKGSWTIIDPAKNFTGIEYSLHPFSPRKPNVMMEITKESRAKKFSKKRNQTKPYLQPTSELFSSMSHYFFFILKSVWFGVSVICSQKLSASVLYSIFPTKKWEYRVLQVHMH